MQHKAKIFFAFFLLASTTSCDELLDEIKPGKPHKPRITIHASGLVSPLGLESDAKGRLWVTEAGTGLTNDGQLTLIIQNGQKFTVVKGFTSRKSPEEAIFGLNHILLHNGILWMLHGVEGRLYKFDISKYSPGAAPLQASDLEYEDIGTYVKNYVFPEDTNETDLFNLTVGPNGDLFIVDAAANAIIRREATTGKLSVFATIPPIDNPSGEPSRVQAVPTGIVFDGSKFLVSSFTGFPFPTQKAPIYQVDLKGNTTVYQTGFSTLTDIELGIDQKPLVVEYGIWTGETFELNSGSIVRSTKGTNQRLISGLNFPNSLERSGNKTYYITQTFDGLIRKMSF